MVSIQFQFCRSQLHTVFLDTEYYFPSIYAKLFLVLFRRKTTKIRIRKRRKRIDTKTAKKEWNKAMKEYKKSKKIKKMENNKAKRNIKRRRRRMRPRKRRRRRRRKTNNENNDSLCVLCCFRTLSSGQGSFLHFVRFCQNLKT
jgi:hypothetical protein